MKYIVSLGILKFEFKDGNTAMSFAELAQKNFVPTEYNTELKPYVMITDDDGGDE